MPSRLPQANLHFILGKQDIEGKIHTLSMPPPFKYKSRKFGKQSGELRATKASGSSEG